MSDENNPEPDVYVAAGIVGDGPEAGAVVSVDRIKARDLTTDHVGKFIGFHTEGPNGYNYAARILKVQHFKEGEKPGVSAWLLMSALPDGTPARNQRMHVPFDTELELIDMIAY